MAKSWGKKQIFLRPEGEIRQSQMVTTYGAGAMVDLVDQAVLVGGLDFWSYDKAEGIPVIQEPRLRDALADRFGEAEIHLSVDAAFREPPVGDSAAATRSRGVQVLEFPQWFVCQNPHCRALIRSRGLERKKGRYFHDCGRRKTEAVPVRFVATCKNGHLSEFPWIWFAHRSREGRCSGPSLSLHEGASGDFSEVTVECLCGASERLSTALATEALPGCSGERPWLGREGREECEHSQRLLVRTASHSYFPLVVSALSVPEKGTELVDKVKALWDVLAAATPETMAAFRTIPKVETGLAGWSNEDVLAAVAAVRRGAPVARDPLRTAEFKQLVDQELEKAGDEPGRDDLFFARRIEPAGGVPRQVSMVVVAKKLREVRVHIGLSRLEAATPDLQGEYDLGVRWQRLGLTTNWLPASELRGEGLFVQLDESAVVAWEDREAVRRRTEELLDGYEAWLRGLRPPPAKPPVFPGARFYMLHSLAHLLISAISLECGYAASAIRERIYCADRTSEVPMAAILLSTGTAGSDGTLGGLVEQARQLRTHLRRAWDMGLLCSNDPVCGAHTPRGDHAERFLEGSACHGCLFIAESSCERFNRYLDRALVVPVIGHEADLAFFGERP
jgi:hypothetical protein